MSAVLIPGHLVRYPWISQQNANAQTAITLDAAGEACYMVGQIILQNPLGGSKTISAAGSGKIVWRSGAVTFSSGSTTFEIGIQDISTSASPAQGDGTFDVKASFTGGGGGVTANAVQTSTMSSGTKTIANGDLVAITFSMTARGGTDSVVVNANHSGLYTNTPAMPSVTDNVAGSVSSTTTALPNAYIIFDDGSIGKIYGSHFMSSSATSNTYNSSTGTADEYGNAINLPCIFYAHGIGGIGNASAAGNDYEFILYSDPFGSPVAEKTIAVDATQLGKTGSVGQHMYLFPVPFLLKANTDYAITWRPTTTSNIVNYYIDTDSATGGLTGPPNSNCYAVRRLDNSGAFSDFNGGTAKTRMMLMWLVGSHLEQGVNSGNYRIGI